MTKLNKLVLVNESNTRGIPSDVFASKDEYKAYCDTINALRLNVSKLCQLERVGVKSVETETLVNMCWDDIRACYAWFNDRENGFKFRPAETDLEAIKVISGICKKDKENDNGREFTPKSLVTFRKDFEQFVAKRIKGEVSKNAAQVDADTAKRREAKRIENAKKKEAETAQKNASLTTSKKTEKAA